MSVFSTNQVRQLYVAKEVKKNPRDLASGGAGSIALISDNKKSHLYFEYKGADNLMRSDIIDVKNILYAKPTDPKAMERNLKSVTVNLDSSVNGGVPVAGQDYILRIAFRQYVGMSDEDQYFKYGMVHAYAGMNADKFYKTLALSISRNFSREVTPLVKIEVHSAAKGDNEGNFTSGYMEVTPSTKDNGKSDKTNPYYTDTLVDDIDGIRITEVEQPWRLGILAQTPVYFTVQPTTIVIDGDDRTWGTVVEGVNGTVGNGKNIADLEYFCMGERGDIYRGIGFPNNIITTYLVDPSKTYYTLDIHYAYVGSNEAVQKSEKTITIVSAVKDDINSLITDFNTATGLNIATFS